MRVNAERVAWFDIKGILRGRRLIEACPARNARQETRQGQRGEPEDKARRKRGDDGSAASPARTFGPDPDLRGGSARRLGEE